MKTLYCTQSYLNIYVSITELVLIALYIPSQLEERIYCEISQFTEATNRSLSSNIYLSTGDIFVHWQAFLVSALILEQPKIKSSTPTSHKELFLQPHQDIMFFVVGKVIESITLPWIIADAINSEIGCWMILCSGICGLQPVSFLQEILNHTLVLKIKFQKKWNKRCGIPLCMQGQPITGLPDNTIVLYSHH